MRLSLLAVACATIACASGSTAKSAEIISPGEPFRMRIEEQGHLPNEDLALRFVSVVGDSRCPRDVTCFWEGNAEIEVLLTHRGEEAAVRLHTHGGASYPTQAGAFGFTLRLEALDPYPVSASAPAAQDYVATLELRKTELRKKGPAEE